MEKNGVVTSEKLKLFIEKKIKNSGIEISLTYSEHAEAILHWGVTTPDARKWTFPPEDLWPKGTTSFQKSALQTPFLPVGGKKKVTLSFDLASMFRAVQFALFYPKEARWDSNGGKNYTVPFPVSGREFETPLLLLKNRGGDALFEKEFDLEEDRLAIRVCAVAGENVTLSFATTVHGNVKLHWGVSKPGTREWFLPPEQVKNQTRSTLAGNNALQTSFFWEEGFNQLNFSFPAIEEFSGVHFLLKTSDPERWIKNRGRDFFVPFRSLAWSDSAFSSGQVAESAETIIDAEMNHNSWTLMHRFDLCFRLIDENERSRELFGLLFVWLRFSALRQLDWQRQYNTQPRALAHAQDRLTLKISEAYRDDVKNRDLVRLLLTTLGPGGEGQKIRDEILNIMHRHNIKEVSGHFMEEWHQKLHNNTTPDDIVICEAYIGFLKSDGNHEVFYDTLKKGGVTRERLAAFERPIVTPPDFVHHLKHPLIHDFENYLRLFKSVHAGNDLEVAINNARGYVDHPLNELLSAIWHSRMDGPLAQRVRLVTEARKGLYGALSHEQDPGKVRALLYLDLALEELSRKMVEGTLHLGQTRDDLIQLLVLAFENICLAHKEEEFEITLCHLRALSEKISDDGQWALLAKSVLDRAVRITGEYLDKYYTLLQPLAENLGVAFHADEWSISVFSEEILRGHLASVFSALNHHIDPILRKSANLGEWQVVSRGQGKGYLRYYDKLGSIQGKKFDEPTVLLVGEVKGDEDIPEGVTAVITPDAVDLVSHVAVRVRNAGVLFATCYDSSIVSQLKSKENSFVGAHLRGSGDVVIDSLSEQDSCLQTHCLNTSEITVGKKTFSSYALLLDEVSPETAGGKSVHSKELKEGLPQWIETPKSIVIPFGVFEKVVKEQGKEGLFQNLLAKLTTDPDTNPKLLETLSRDLSFHEGVVSAVQSKMTDAGFSESFDPQALWKSIKGVWASVWSKRAVESRRVFGFPDDAISMAVLVQEVIPAEYAFVIHTVNPSTGKKDELFAEVVPGLGETLVGSHAGRAFGFLSNKKKSSCKVVSFPSKSYSLKGSGIICRSDSSAEDLSSYSGAGVYDSILLSPPKKHLNEYVKDPLIADPAFRESVVQKITGIGNIVEKYFKAPQDIEGVYAQGKWYVVQARPQAGVN